MRNVNEIKKKIMCLTTKMFSVLAFDEDGLIVLLKLAKPLSHHQLTLSLKKLMNMDMMLMSAA